MAWALLLFGLIALMAAWKNRTDELYQILKENFTGKNNFIIWVTAIIFLAIIGMNKTLRPISDAFMILIIIVIILAAHKKNKDILQLFINELKKGTSGNG
jgi:quinol-cytochrome oxidoreductase complex cytochrome b subunit